MKIKFIKPVSTKVDGKLYRRNAGHIEDSRFGEYFVAIGVAVSLEVVEEKASKKKSPKVSVEVEEVKEEAVEDDAIPTE